MNEYEQKIINNAAKYGYVSEAAEKSLIGSIILYYDRCAHIVSELAEDDLYVEAHKAILKAIKLAKAEQFAIDMVTVSQELIKTDPIKANTIIERLADCTQNAEIWSVESHFQIVKELSARRRAIELVGKIGNELQNPANSLNAIVEKLTENASDLLIGGHKWVSMNDIIVSTYNHIQQRAAGLIRSITSGVGNVDAVIGGFFGGELTVIGARPAVGKSVFGMNIAMAAAKQGYKVAVVSREMSDVQYGQRILSHASGVDGSSIRKAQLTDDELECIVDSLPETARLPISFLFTTKTVEDLRAEVQRKYNRKEIDMLIVDYLQLMDTAERYDQDRLRVGHISRELKNMATDFNIPVIALAQVKRYAGGARARMPTLEDLKDSGSIEQDADNVIFLHNPYDAEDEFIDPRDKDSFYIYQNAGYTYLCIGIAKQRQGATGICCTLFDKQKMRYIDIDRTHATEAQTT